MTEKQMRDTATFQNIKKALSPKLLFLAALLCAGISLNAANVGTNKRVTLKVENEGIKNIFQEIEKQADVHFMYESSQINANQKISLKLNNVTLEQALDK
ncbi:MAG: hypothetical protein EOO44_22300, partial [Flavobacterium sp.]